LTAYDFYAVSYFRPNGAIRSSIIRKDGSTSCPCAKTRNAVEQRRRLCADRFQAIAPSPNAKANSSVASDKRFNSDVRSTGLVLRRTAEAFFRRIGTGRTNTN